MCLLLLGRWGLSGLLLLWDQSGLVCLLLPDLWGRSGLLLLWDQSGRLFLALLLGLWLPSHQLHQLDLSDLEDLVTQLVRFGLWGQLVLEQGIYTGRVYSSPCSTHCCYYNTYNFKPPV